MLIPEKKKNQKNHKSFQVSQWYVLNDFSINTILPSEATWFNLTWKLPCIFFYVAEDQVRRKMTKLQKRPTF